MVSLAATQTTIPDSFKPRAARPGAIFGRKAASYAVGNGFRSANWA